MNTFETSLRKLAEESEEIQKEEFALSAKQQLFMQKFQGFLQESGLPKNFTLPQLALLAVSKSKESTLILP